MLRISKGLGVSTEVDVLTGRVKRIVLEQNCESVDTSENDTASQSAGAHENNVPGMHNREAYKNPSPKATARESFWIMLMLSFSTRGIGNTRMAISLAMVDAALAHQVATWFTQCPGVLTYHIFFTGTQRKMKTKTMVMTQAITKPPIPYAQPLKLPTGKIR